MATELLVVKGQAVQVFDNQPSDKLSDIAVDCSEANAITVSVFVTGSSPSATLTVEGASSSGGNSLTLPDLNATQSVTANTSFDVIVGSRWVRLRLATVTGTFAQGQGFTIYVTPYVSPGSARVSASIVVDTLAAIQTQTGALVVGTGGSISSGATGILTGDGYWLDYNAGTPRLRVGTVSGGALVLGMYWDGANLAWTGTNTSLTAAGLFTAANAVITGTITTTNLTATLTSGVVRTAASGARVEMDSTGIKWYDATTQRGEILATGAGWLGASGSFSWTTAGVVSMDGAFINNSTITSGKLSISQLSAITADLGSITAGTITGGTIQTAASGARVVLGTTGVLWYDATTQRGQILNDGSGWMGSSTAFAWTTSGAVTLASGTTIGGFDIGADYIRDAANSMGMASTVTGVDDVRFWAGDSFTNRATAPARIYESGVAVFTNITATGVITATSGSIGSFTIGTYLYTGSKTAWNDANAGVHIGSDGIGIGNNVFTVNGSTGALVATSATITGAITATSGSITGAFTIGTGGTLASGATAVLTGDGYWLAYNAGTPVFRVGTVALGALVKGFYWDGTNPSWIGVNTSLTAAGLFTASNAVITGTITTSNITATGGTIGGWTLAATTLTGGNVVLDSTGVITIRPSAGANSRFIFQVSGETYPRSRIYMDSTANQFRLEKLDETTGAVQTALYLASTAIGLFAGSDGFIIYDSTGATQLAAVSQTGRFAPGNQTTRYLYDAGTTSGLTIAGGPFSTTGYIYPGTGSALQTAAYIYGGTTLIGINGEIRNTAIIRTTGVAATHLASSGGLEFVTGSLRIRSQGADASTKGGFTFLGITSDGSADTTFMTITNTGNVTIAGTLTVSGDQTGATDHVFDHYDDLALLQDWRAGRTLPFATGDLLNRDRLLRDSVVGLHTRIATLEAEVSSLKARLN